MGASMPPQSSVTRTPAPYATCSAPLSVKTTACAHGCCSAPVHDLCSTDCETPHTLKGHCDACAFQLVCMRNAHHTGSVQRHFQLYVHYAGSDFPNKNIKKHSWELLYDSYGMKEQAEVSQPGIVL